MEICDVFDAIYLFIRSNFLACEVVVDVSSYCSL